VEIIVVIDHCQRLFERGKRELTGAVVIPNREARGASGARNSGIAAARGEIIAFLDDDTRAEPGWLELLVAPYESEEVIAVGGRIEPDWERGRPAYFPEEFDWVVGCTYSGMPSTRAIVRNVIGANMSFRREALEASGGFSHGIDRVGLPGKAGWLRFGSEETELCIRIRRRLAPRVVVYEPSAVVTHRVPESRAGVRYFASRCLAEGRSKALLARIAGRSDALETERRYVTHVLPAAVARCLSAAARGDLAALLRATLIAAGAAMAALGYVYGTLLRAQQPQPFERPPRPLLERRRRPPKLALRLAGVGRRVPEQEEQLATRE
jgi:cellulose synthase/poly-beta-1,6-N-acetylglucosamine synthase-like glycosyltransferase